MAKILKTKRQMIDEWKSHIICTGQSFHINVSRSNSECCYLIEIMATDVIKILHSQGECGPKYYYGFICPNCKAFNEIDEKDIPYFIKENIKPITLTEFKKLYGPKPIDSKLLSSILESLDYSKKVNLSEKNF